MWLQWLMARLWKRPLRLRLGLELRKESFSAHLDFSPLAPVSLGGKSSSHTCGLVVTYSTTGCIHESFLSHLVHLCGLTTNENLHSLASCLVL